MRKVLIAAALLVCLAATALAGGTQEKETPEYFKKPIEESGTEYTYGENMPGVYTYGGSRRDWINGMAVAPDGRIAVTGYTESSDGTLSDRTKTWRAGWVMMLDQDMNVLWNFCSRSGDADHMRCPVFRDNGQMTAVHHTEGKQMKIVWIDENGEEAFSDTVMTVKEEGERISVIGAMEEGYLMLRSQENGRRRTFTLFDWLGGQLWTLAGVDGVQAVSGNHLMCETQEGLFLSSVDTGGLLTTLCSVAQMENGSVKREYESMISLADGGAAACGRIWEGTTPANAQGILSHWDAQGNLVFEMIVAIGKLSEMVQTESGFAAAGYAQDDLGADVQWMLLEFDENGILCGRQDLYDNESTTSTALASVASDGRLFCAQSVGEHAYEDVLVTVVKTK